MDKRLPTSAQPIARLHFQGSSSSSSQPHPDRPLGKMPDEELSNHKRAAKTLLVWSFGLALIRGCSSGLEVPTTT
jgi:hypothetical protein